MIFSGGYVHGHLYDENGVLYSIQMRIGFSSNLKEFFIRNSVAYRCSKSFNNDEINTPLKQIYPTHTSDLYESTNFSIQQDEKDLK